MMNNPKVEEVNPVPSSPSQFKKMATQFSEWVVSIIFAVVAVFLIQNYLALPTQVSGESMMPTMKDGEKFISNRIIYRLSEPKFGDVVTFHASESKDFVKRVIATEGQSVSYKNDTLWIDGRAVDEPFLAAFKEQAHKQGLKLTNDFGPVTVPDGEVFVLGDNRSNSRDSRMIGTIPKSSIIGRADIVFWPLSSMRVL